MTKKQKENFATLAQQTGLQMDAESGVLYGQREGFQVLLAMGQESPYPVTAMFSAVRSTGPLTKDECKELAKQHKEIHSVVQEQNSITVQLRIYTNWEKSTGSIDEALRVMTAYLRENGFENVCQRCGRPGAARACRVNGANLLLCGECYGALSQDTAVHTQMKKHKHESVVGGVVGALGGSLIGVLCIVLISRLGYVAAISGIVMAVCTLKGYELLGGKMTRRGVVISVVVMVLMTYCADRLDWAIIVAREFEAGLLDAYRAFPALMREEIIDATNYYLNLAQVYLFVLLGAVPMVHSLLKKQKDEGRIYCMEETQEASVSGM